MDPSHAPFSRGGYQLGCLHIDQKHVGPASLEEVSWKASWKEVSWSIIRKDWLHLELCALSWAWPGLDRATEGYTTPVWSSGCDVLAGAGGAGPRLGLLRPSSTDPAALSWLLSTSRFTQGFLGETWKPVNAQVPFVITARIAGINFILNLALVLSLLPCN